MNTTEYSIIDVIYPIGSIYMSVNTTDPSTLFPNTTWEKIENRFLLGSGSSYNSGDTGGSKDAAVVSHKHEPSNNDLSFLASNGNVALNTVKRAFPSTSSSGVGFVYGSTDTYINEYETTSTVGVSGTDQNMPPYFVVNIWKRIS